MSSIETFAAFLGWCTAINMGALLLASVLLAVLRGWVSSIHGKMFALDERDLSRAYFQYLAQYKIAFVIFNLVPYIALRIIS